MIHFGTVLEHCWNLVGTERKRFYYIWCPNWLCGGWLSFHFGERRPRGAHRAGAATAPVTFVHTESPAGRPPQGVIVGKGVRLFGCWYLFSNECSSDWVVACKK